jgi:hypothetical protein
MDTESDNGSSSEYDYEEVYVRFDSRTQIGDIDYIMLGSTCYQVDEVCHHDVVIYFQNGEIQQCTKNKKQLQILMLEHKIDVRSNGLFEHLLE